MPTEQFEGGAICCDVEEPAGAGNAGAVGVFSDCALAAQHNLPLPQQHCSGGGTASPEAALNRLRPGVNTSATLNKMAKADFMA